MMEFQYLFKLGGRYPVSKPPDNGNRLKRSAIQAGSTVVPKKWKLTEQNSAVPRRLQKPVPNFNGDRVAKVAPRDNLRYVETTKALPQVRQIQKIKGGALPEMKQLQKERYVDRAKVLPQIKEIKRGVDSDTSKREIEKKTEDVSVNKKVQRKSTDTNEALDRPVTEPQGHYEMNPLLQGALERELDGLMKKVMQCLPTKAKAEADQLVMDTFRSKAVHEFKDVLGLNVTKRVLNVYNKLYVKLQFSLPPTAPVLHALRSRYNMALLRPVGGGDIAVLYVAGFQRIQDFDNICAANQIYCHGITITVSPVYRFTVCPPQLKISTSHKPDATGDSAKPKSEDLTNLDNAEGIKPQATVKVEAKTDTKTPIAKNQTAAALTVKSASVSKSVTPQAKKEPPVSLTKTLPVKNEMGTVKQSPVAKVEVPQVKKEPQTPVKIAVAAQVKKQLTVSKSINPTVKKVETPISKSVTPQVKEEPTVSVTDAPLVKNVVQKVKQTPVPQVNKEPQTPVKIAVAPQVKKQLTVSKSITPTVKKVETPISKSVTPQVKEEPTVSVTDAPLVKNIVQKVKQTPVPQVNKEPQTPVKITAAPQVKKQLPVSKPATQTVKKDAPVGNLVAVTVKKQPPVVKTMKEDNAEKKTESGKKGNEGTEKLQSQNTDSIKSIEDAEEIDFDSLMNNALVLDECNSDDD